MARRPLIVRAFTRLEGPQTLGRGPIFWVGAAIVLGLAMVYPLVSDPYTVGNTVYLFDWAFMALGLCLIWGYAGGLSFGQTAFFGIAGYAYGVITLNYGADAGRTLWAALGAVALSGVAAAMLGYFLFFGRHQWRISRHRDARRHAGARALHGADGGTGMAHRGRRGSTASTA